MLDDLISQKQRLQEANTDHDFARAYSGMIRVVEFNFIKTMEKQGVNDISQMLTIAKQKNIISNTEAFRKTILSNKVHLEDKHVGGISSAKAEVATILKIADELIAYLRKSGVR